jgi:hypothetical protein
LALGTVSTVASPALGSTRMGLALGFAGAGLDPGLIRVSDTGVGLEPVTTAAIRHLGFSDAHMAVGQIRSLAY